jgi:hypothetical protein
LERLAHRPPRKLVATTDAPTFRPEINKRSKRLSSEYTWWDRLSSPAWQQAEKLRNHFKKTIDKIEEDDDEDEDFAFLYEEYASPTNGILQLDVAEETINEGAMLELDYSNFEQDILEQRQSTSREKKYSEDLQTTDGITATQQVHQSLVHKIG